MTKVSNPDGSVTVATTPVDTVPGQSLPGSVPYWAPGTSYQPGALVQANNYGTVTQSAISNADFELGNQDWTGDGLFSIGVGTAFQGTQRAVFAGQTPPRAIFSGGDSGAGTYGPQVTDFDSTILSNSFANSPVLVAASSSRFVTAETGALEFRHSTDGSSWTAIVSPLATNAVSLFRSDTANRFLAFTTTTEFAHSTDGVTWTTGTLPVASGAAPHYLVEINGSIYLCFGTTMLGSSDGITWATRNAAVPFTFDIGVVAVDDELVALDATGTTVQRVWRSTNEGTSWTEDTDASTSLQAAWIDGANQRSMANNGSTLIAAYHSSSSNVANVVRSADAGRTWTVTSTAVQGYFPVWLPSANVFALPSDLAAFGGETVFTSDDGGVSWTSFAPSLPPLLFEATGPAGESPVTFNRRTYVSDDRPTSFGGQIVRAKCKVRTSTNGEGSIGITFFDSGGIPRKATFGNALSGESTVWREIEVSAVAPLNTVSCAVTLGAQGSGEVLFDDVQWNHFTQSSKLALIFEATQADAGFSGSVEPVWPTVVGNTIVDNEVTWTVREANCVVWEAKPILFSGAAEPTWPLEEGGTVVDGEILWTADSGRIRDRNCPNTKQVAIASGKVFAGDEDIVAYSATVNPLDWSSADDAGYIPFGLNTYGAEPVSALGLYRSNLVIWNSVGFQMWQVDADPQNFAILDAIPVGNRFARGASPVSNDLVWPTDEGVRNMGIAGAAANLQAGFFGKQIDPLVEEAIDAIADEDDVISLFYPGAGQYWLIFRETAYVLTMNGGRSDMSWSRYVFPAAIDDYTIRDEKLYLRAGDLVWLFDEDAVQDDVNGTPTDFEGRVWWHYLDFGAIGITKALIGFDVVASGTFNVAVGYNQRDNSIATTDYQLTGDTLPDDVIPLPVTSPSMQFRLTWAGGEAWEWQASALYLQDWRLTS